MSDETKLLAEIRKALADCPIPEDARPDWRGTNHWEVTAFSQAETREGHWWFIFSDVAEFRVDGDDPCEDEQCRRLGALYDYGCRYKRDVSALLSLAEKVEKQAAALHAVLSRLDYLQELWGKEGITDGLAQTVRSALSPEGDKG